MKILSGENIIAIIKKKIKFCLTKKKNLKIKKKQNKEKKIEINKFCVGKKKFITKKKKFIKKSPAIIFSDSIAFRQIDLGPKNLKKKLPAIKYKFNKK